ncbi:MAG: glutamate mutase L, partial [Actinomycetota bacterium]|nr:glutamate mutase L [Actinomycetota bacterium]
ATTDVHSAVELDPEDVGLSREVVASTPLTRTVEGDLGMRWSAVSTTTEAIRAGLADDSLIEPARRRQADPAYLPDSPAERDADESLATAAVVLALRRHAGRSQVVVGPDGRVVERSGRDLRGVGLLVGSGGVLRVSEPATAERILGAATGPTPEGWQQPEQPGVVVDRDCVLAAVGLLADQYPRAAESLAAHILGPEQPAPPHAAATAEAGGR